MLNMQHQSTSDLYPISATHILETGIQVLVIPPLGAFNVEPSNNFGWYTSVLEVGVPNSDTSLPQSRLLSPVGWLVRHERRHITAG